MPPVTVGSGGIVLVAAADGDVRTWKSWKPFRADCTTCHCIGKSVASDIEILRKR
jgi:hypothetical protein